MATNISQPRGLIKEKNHNADIYMLLNRIKEDLTESEYDIFIIKCISIFFIFPAVSMVTKN